MHITTETGEINRSVLSYIISGYGSPQVEISVSKTKFLIVDDERERDRRGNCRIIDF